MKVGKGSQIIGVGNNLVQILVLRY